MALVEPCGHRGEVVDVERQMLVPVRRLGRRASVENVQGEPVSEVEPSAVLQRRRDDAQPERLVIEGRAAIDVRGLDRDVLRLRGLRRRRLRGHRGRRLWCRG